MLKSFIIAVVFSSVAVAVPRVARTSEVSDASLSAADAVAQAVTEVNSYLEWFFRKAPRGGGLQKAQPLVPLVVAAAYDAGVDPLLLAVEISCESTWRTGVFGARGEVGLLQVHGAAAEGFDVTTPEGQLSAGARWLARHLGTHGLLGGIVRYIGDNEQAKRSGKYRYDAYLKELARQGLPLEGRNAVLRDRP